MHSHFALRNVVELYMRHGICIKSYSSPRYTLLNIVLIFQLTAIQKDKFCIIVVHIIKLPSCTVMGIQYACKILQ